MYSVLARQTLEDRIGWSNPIPPNTNIVLTVGSTLSTSGRFFDSFHKLCIVENIWKSIVNVDIENASFNAELLKLRKETVSEVLNKIFDTNPFAYAKENPNWSNPNYKTDYSDVILEKQSLFDDCIGYAMAVRCLQLILSTTRSNIPERKNAEFYQIVKTELEGVVNENGILIANGINGQYNASIINAINILFPIIGKGVSGAGSGSGSGGTNSMLQKPTLKFKTIW